MTDPKGDFHSVHVSSSSAVKMYPKVGAVTVSPPSNDWVGVNAPPGLQGLLSHCFYP